MKNEFTKSNLKNGMIIQCKDGNIGFIMDNKIYFVGETGREIAYGYDDLIYYNENLTYTNVEYLKEDDEYDIVGVWNNRGSLVAKEVARIVENNEPIWVRKKKEECKVDYYPFVPDCNSISFSDTPTPRMSKSAFVKYIQTLEDFDSKLNNLISTICPPEENKRPTFADELESEYVALIADMLGIDSNKNDNLFDWCFADNFGEAEEMVSFDGECMYAADVYEKLISK